MNDQELAFHLEEVGAVLRDSHFVFTNGMHAPVYVNLARVFNNPQVANLISDRLAALLLDLSFTAIVAPTNTGAVLAGFVANALARRGRLVHPLYAPKGEGETRIFERDQAVYVPNEPVLIFDDLLTTGGTFDHTKDLVLSTGGRVVAYSALCDRGGFGERYDNLPLFSAMSASLEQWPEDECKACIQQVPMNTKVGHGKKWLESHPDPKLWPAYVRAKAV